MRNRWRREEGSSRARSRENEICGASPAALAPLVLLLIATCGCVSGRYAGDLGSQHECSSVAGVFFNAGKNDKDPAKVLYPDELKAFLLEELDRGYSLRQDLRRGREISVAIRYVGESDLRFAALDRDGKILAAGTSRRYHSCSRGVLKTVFVREGTYSDKKTKYTLVINSEGKLVVSKERSRAELGLSLVGKTQWQEFAPNPRLDVRDVDFDWECAYEPCRSRFRGAQNSRGELLTALRELLDLVALAPRGKVADPRGLGLDVDLLAGASRDEVLGALGEPEFCYDGGSRTTPLPIVPCSSRGVETVYYFYRLPQGHLGGGPELHLGFSDRGQCEWASWLYTQ